MAVGTAVGGPIGDRIGRKPVIWGSILGVLPFTLVLPYADLAWTTVLSVIIGADPGLGLLGHPGLRAGDDADRVGMISGLFFGFAFGMAGLGAAVLGLVADQAGIVAVYRLCSFLPVLGLLTWFLPDVGEKR